MGYNIVRPVSYIHHVLLPPIGNVATLSSVADETTMRISLSRERVARENDEKGERKKKRESEKKSKLKLTIPRNERSSSVPSHPTRIRSRPTSPSDVRSWTSYVVSIASSSIAVSSSPFHRRRHRRHHRPRRHRVDDVPRMLDPLSIDPRSQRPVRLRHVDVPVLIAIR